MSHIAYSEIHKLRQEGGDDDALDVEEFIGHENTNTYSKIERSRSKTTTRCVNPDLNHQRNGDEHIK